MVQTIGKLAETYSLFQAGGASRAARAGSTDSIASLLSSTQNTNGKDAATTAIPSILDNNQTQAASGDFVSAFQRLSSSLQSLMVQLQSQSSTKTVAASGDSLATTPTSSSSTSAPDGSEDASNGAATTATSAAAAPNPNRYYRAGDWALQGDANALLDDLHGFIQVANGDASVPADDHAAIANANDNSTYAVSNNVAATALPVDGMSTSESGLPSSSLATASTSDTAAASALSDVTYNFAQNLFQALQNYGAASANATLPQRNESVSAVG